MDVRNYEEMAALAELAGANVRRNHLPQKTVTEDGAVESVTFTPEQLSDFAEMVERGKSQDDFLAAVGRTLENERAGINPVDVSFREVPEIAAFLNSVRTADDRTMKMRMAELRALEMPRAAWNAFGIAARITLLNHPAYGPVISVVQEKGGI